MLRLFFEGIEKSLGPSLDDTASIAWTFGLMLVALQTFTPLARVMIELTYAQAGLERAWVIACATCGTRSVLGGACVKCGAPLKVPAFVRFFRSARRRSRSVQRAGWGWSSLGAIVFLLCSMRLFAVLAPTGKLERLFAGAALCAWAGIGFFLGRALGPRGGGPISRLRELFFAGAATALLGCVFFLEQTVHPVPERVIAHVTVSPGQVDLDGAKLSLGAPDELGLELQLVEHPALGLARVLPLAWVGATRSPIDLGSTDAWLRDSSWKHAQALMSAGAQVKRRTETFPIASGARYDVVLREHDVLLRPAK
jgi:hypothetical protein